MSQLERIIGVLERMMDNYPDDELIFKNAIQNIRLIQKEVIDK